MLRFFKTLGLVLLMGQAPQAWANDTAISSDPGRVRILKNQEIVMKSERIELTYEGPCLGDDSGKSKGGFFVEAHYVFVNPTARAQQVRFGFPEALCNPQMGDCAGDDPTFQDMVTTVRGVPVDTSIEQLDEQDVASAGRVWAYDVKLRPKEQIDIVHRFFVVGMVDVAGARGLSYLVETGKNWARPIGEAQFRYLLPVYVTAFIHRPDQAWGDGTSSGLSQASVQYLELDGTAYLELVYTAKNWSPPASNVDISFESGCLGSGGQGLPEALFDPKQRAASLGQAARYCAWKDFVAGYQGSAPASAQLAASSSDMQICEQAVYALRGKPFLDPYLRDYFYKGRPPAVAPYPAFSPNPKFVAAFLQPQDLAAIGRFRGVRRSAAPPALRPKPLPTAARSKVDKSGADREAAKQAGLEAVSRSKQSTRSAWSCALASTRFGWGGLLGFFGLLPLHLLRRRVGLARF